MDFLRKMKINLLSHNQAKMKKINLIKIYKLSKLLNECIKNQILKQTER